MFLLVIHDLFLVESSYYQKTIRPRNILFFQGAEIPIWIVCDKLVFEYWVIIHMDGLISDVSKSMGSSWNLLGRSRKNNFQRFFNHFIAYLKMLSTELKHPNSSYNSFIYNYCCFIFTDIMYI